MIKRVLTYALVITTMVWSVGLLATPIAVGAAVTGDLIKLQCSAGAGVDDPCRAVYYLGADGKRYVFTNQKAYSTWYANFSGVKVVSSTEMSSYPIGGNVTYRPGVKMVKITTDPKVYAVSANGTLRWVTTEAIAVALYGSNWNTKIDDVADAFFVNYTVGSDVSSSGAYDAAAETSGATSISDDKNLAGGPAVPSGSSLAVSLASDTPATGYMIGNTIHNKFTKVNFTASADGDITIDQLVVRRGGTVAADGAFAGIVLLDGSTMIRTEDAKTLSSEHKATFNKDIKIPAGTTKSYYIAANMASSLASYAGQIPSLDLLSVTLAGGAVSGTLPIVGNYQQLDGTITIGALTVANGGNNPSASTQKIGTTNYIVSGIKLTANSVEDFKVSSIAFKQGGTAGDGDVSNLELLVDDAQVASVASPADGKVTFNLSGSPITIEKGKSKTFDLRLDIGDGSSRTIRFDLEDETDVQAVGQLYGATVKVSAGTGATADAEPFWTAVVTTIDTGSLRVGPATLVSTNVANDTDQAVLGKFEFEAKGEPIILTRFPVGFIVTTSSVETDVTAADLTNVTVYDENGVIVAGPTDSAGLDNIDGNTFFVGATSTDTVTVASGVHIYTVKGDVSADWDADDTLYAYINPTQLTAKGDVTGLTVTPTPASDQQSATMTIKTAKLDVSVSSLPVAQTVVAGTQQWTFANVVMDAANSGEDVKVTTVKVAVKGNASANPAETSNWKIFDGSTNLSVTNDPSSDTALKTTDADSATATFTFTTPLIITKGTAKTLSLKGDITNSATNGTISVGMPDTTGADHVTARGNVSATDASITISASDGQAQTITGTGTLDMTIDSSTPKASLIPDGSTGVTIAIFNFTSRYEDINVEKIYFTSSATNSGGWDQADQLHVYKGSTLLKSVTPTATDASGDTVLVDMTNSPLVVAKDTSVLVTLKIDTATADDERQLGKGESGEDLAVKINAAGDVTAKGAQSGDTLDTGKTVTSAAGNAQYLYRSVPVIVPNKELSGGVSNVTLLAGTNDYDFYKFKVTAGSTGDIGLYSFAFVVTTSTATVTEMYLYKDSVLLATASTTQNITNATEPGNSEVWLTTFALTDDGSIPIVTGAPEDPSVGTGGVGIADVFLPIEAVVPAGQSYTYTLKGKINCSNVGCSGSTGSGSASFQLLGDGSVQSTLPDTATILNAEAVYERSIQWTDFYKTSILQRSSTTATWTAQWSNGYLIKDSTGNNLAATSVASTISR